MNVYTLGILVALVGCGKVNEASPDAARHVDASADAASGGVTLNVVPSGTGIGSISSSPAGIDCGSACTAVFPAGTMVTLTATPTGGTSFMGWSGGGCSGTGTCVVSLDAMTSVTPAFNCSSGSSNITYTGTIVTFAAPLCVKSVTIDAYGGQGGNAGANAGGLGAHLSGTFAITGSEQFRVLVGGAGVASFDLAQQGGGTGGGGTFVTQTDNMPLIVAGGGGGACFVSSGGSCSAVGGPGLTTTAGGNSSDGSLAGGVNGNGGLSSTWNGWQGGSGGAGLIGNGVNNTTGNATYGTPNAPGSSFTNGGAGGIAGNSANARNGSFGGGGAAGFTGGGGGGYSGGAAGGSSNGAGGGGGSFNAGTAQTNTAGARSGSGQVTFTY